MVGVRMEDKISEIAGVKLVGAASWILTVLRMACFSQKARRSFRSAPGSAKSPNFPYFGGWSLFLQSEPLAISESKDQTAVHEGEVFAGVQSVLLSAVNRGQLFRSAMLGGFTQVSPRSSTLALFDSQLRFS